MPRDLVAEKESILRDMPALQHADKTNAQQQPPNPSSASPSVSLPPNSSSSAAHHDTRDKISRDMDKQDAWSALNPYTKSLTPSDVDSCVALENVAFAPQERATKEKVRYVKCFISCSITRSYPIMHVQSTPVESSFASCAFICRHTRTCLVLAFFFARSGMWPPSIHLHDHAINLYAEATH